MSAGAERPLEGKRLGPYEIVTRVGAGGMGEVYRARDTRLGRDVALKLLSNEFGDIDRQKLHRFEQEARAASALSHPNIVTVYETGEADSVSYIAMELVEGQTLRQLLRAGGLPTRKLVEVATQIAEGLARAHEAGIVHRDLKPENVIVTPDGIVKILDFGLAKLSRSFIERGADADEGTLPLPTRPGVLLGTVRYMSPEQASGLAADFRSDQFSFGSVLYEMATGEAAFQKPATVDTLSSILHEEPSPIVQKSPKTPVPLRWIIERCLAKDPRDRYASTEDLARDLALVRDHSLELTSGEVGKAPVRHSRMRALAAAALVVAAAVAVGAYLRGRDVGRASFAWRFRQLTFRGAGIPTARFARDGHTIVYAAQWDGKPLELFTVRTESPESRPLNLPATEVLSISRLDEMAVLLGRTSEMSLRPPHAFVTDRDPRLLYGTLARMPLGGGEPREVLEQVRDADWSPDGQALAVVHFVDGQDQLEYPIGTVVERANQWLNHPRVSPDGRRLAFLRIHSLSLAERGAPARDLGIEVDEIAWSPRTGEVLFDTVESGSTRIRGLRPGGRTREVATLPGDFVFHDVGPGGELLLGRVFESSEVFVSRQGEPRDRGLSWFERSVAVDLSRDGGTLLFSESGTGSRGGPSTVYLRRTDGSPARRLGDGFGMALSPDGKWVLAIEPPDSALVLIPTGAGSIRPLSTGAVTARGRGAFFPDGRRVFFMGMEKGRGVRAYVLALDGGPAVAVSPEGTRRGILSGDGGWVAARAPDGAWNLYPTDPGAGRRIAGLLPDEEPIGWSADGQFLFVRGADEVRGPTHAISTRVLRLDPWSGARLVWKEIEPINPMSGGGIGTILFDGEGRVCVYTHRRYSSDLFLAEGLVE